MKFKIVRYVFVAVAITMSALSLSFCMRISLSRLSDGILTSQTDFTSLNSKIELSSFHLVNLLCIYDACHVIELSTVLSAMNLNFYRSKLITIIVSFSLFHQTYRCLLMLNKLTRPEPSVCLYEIDSGYYESKLYLLEQQNPIKCNQDFAIRFMLCWSSETYDTCIWSKMQMLPIQFIEFREFIASETDNLGV